MYNYGGAENDGHKNDEPPKCLDMKSTVINLTDQVSMHKIEGHEKKQISTNWQDTK